MAAVSKDGRALVYAAEPLKADKDITLAALFAPNIKRYDTHTSIYDDELDEYVQIIKFISTDLYGDEEITFRLIDLYDEDDLPLELLYSFVQKYSDRLAYSSTDMDIKTLKRKSFQML